MMENTATEQEIKAKTDTDGTKSLKSCIKHLSTIQSSIGMA